MTSRSTTSLSFERLPRAALRYIGLVLGVVVLLILVPELVLFLPNLTR